MENDDLVVPFKAIFSHKDIRDIGVWFEEGFDMGIFPKVPVVFGDIIGIRIDRNKLFDYQDHLEIHTLRGIP